MMTMPGWKSLTTAMNEEGKVWELNWKYWLDSIVQGEKRIMNYNLMRNKDYLFQYCKECKLTFSRLTLQTDIQ